MEKALIRYLHEFPHVIHEAAAQFSPSLLANYLFALAKEYNQFYQGLSVLNAQAEEEKQFRLQLSGFTVSVLNRGLKLLGIIAPDRM
jgi:arginyl-tRNA synthetase